MEPEGPYKSYDGGIEGGEIVFLRVCPRCSRFVKADGYIYAGENGVKPGANATCKKCGRVEMSFSAWL